MIQRFDRRYVIPMAAISAMSAMAVLLVSSPVAARESGGPDFSRTGIYLGGGMTYATDLYEDEIEDALDTGFDVDIDDTFGVNARLGARFLRFLAVEIQYEWLDDYDIKVPNAGGRSKVKTQTLTGNLKIYVPIKRFQPYLLGGIGYQRYEVDSNYFNGTVQFQQDDYDLAGRVGLGFDIYLTEHLVFFSEGSAVLSDARLSIPVAGGVDNLFYAGFQGGLLWRF